MTDTAIASTPVLYTQPIIISSTPKPYMWVEFNYGVQLARAMKRTP